MAESCAGCADAGQGDRAEHDEQLVSENSAPMMPGAMPEHPSLADLPNLPADSSSATTNGSVNGPPLIDLSGLSSGSGRGLDRAIAAAERAVREEDSPAEAPPLSRRVVLDSIAGQDKKTAPPATPFANCQLQDQELLSVEGNKLGDRLPGAESLSDKEADLYQNLVQELKSDGTLSSEMSDLFTYMSMSPSQDLSEDEVVRKEGVMQKLRTRLPSKSAAQLAHLDSDSIITLYNHHVLTNRGKTKELKLH
ncbi:g10506 [Coccomyxa viridis]|uniref:G10506 protein n=1 Tax=Coccomyxa viridis TaxID=1274662 RepID=A0ABP1G895_9CHLO